MKAPAALAGIAVPSFYVTGGTLRADAPSYVERAADKELFDGLTKGEFCYVLTARQMGKSSLMVRTAARLRAQGTAVAAIDLTTIGQNLSVEQWYDGLLSLLGRALGLEDALEQFWLANQRLGPLQRWMAALAQVVLPKVCVGEPARSLVIFIDEIDTVRSLPFSSDEFFAAIRACWNRRTDDPAFERLTFCLLGVATPSDLIRDSRMTPFNIGRRIELNDFTPQEALPLALGLAEDRQRAESLIQRVLYWTNGHPYLTQRLCRAVAERGTATHSDDVDKLCRELFLSVHARERDDNLIFVRERLLHSEADRATLLDLYSKVRRGKRVIADETNPLVSVTRLSGISRTTEGRLQVRNQIYRDVFDNRWILSNMPDAELRRQRAAFKRGVIGTVAGVVVLAGLLSVRVFKADQTTPLELTAFEGQVELLRPGAPDATTIGQGDSPHPAVVVEPLPFSSAQLETGTLPSNFVPQAYPASNVATNAALATLTHANLSETAAPGNATVLVFLEGTVEIRRTGANAWDPGRTNQVLMGGDMLRTASGGRASLQLADKSIMRIGEKSLVQLPAGPRRRSGFDVLKGIVFFVRGDKPALEYQTIEKDIPGETNLPQQIQEWIREGWSVLSISAPIQGEEGKVYRKATLRRPKDSPLEIKTTNATALIRG